MQDLKKIIMEEIGLYADNTGCIIDQDTIQPVKFRNKNLKEDMSKGFRKNDIVFDPVNNLKQMESLFKYATNKDNIDVLSYGSHLNKDGTYTCIVCTNDSTIESKGYNNPTLGYIENMLSLYDNKMDLSEYDIVEEEEDKE